jgi:hypothetical protein
VRERERKSKQNTLQLEEYPLFKMLGAGSVLNLGFLLDFRIYAYP